MEAWGQEQVSHLVTLLHSPFARDSLSSEEEDAVLRVAQVTVLGQSSPGTRDLAWEAGRADLIEIVLQVHGRGAPSFVVALFLEPSSDGVDDSFTAAELQLRLAEVLCHLFGYGGQQGFRFETSKSLAWWLPFFFFNAIKEALAIQETMGPECGLHSAMMLTMAWRARTSWAKA